MLTRKIVKESTKSQYSLVIYIIFFKEDKTNCAMYGLIKRKIIGKQRK